MVQQLFDEVERLKAEVKRLRGRVDAFSAGGQIIQGSITGGSTLPPPTPGHVLVGISDTQWGKTPMPAWGWDEGGEGGGGDGDPGPPGPIGPTGAAGSQGPMGPAGAMLIMDPDEPEEAMPIPGPVGVTGATGATGAGLSIGMSFQNEVKGWPCLLEIGSGIDLVTLNQWWDDEGTPTTKASAVPSSGEAGLDAKFLQVIKCVTDAADEGFLQRYTYADEPRVKSGSHLSALVWVATTAGGSGITAKLRNSGGSSTSGTSIATDGDWTLLYIEDHTCSGTYVELVITKDASGTFYAGGPITVMVGTEGVLLSPRKEVYRWRDFGADHDFDFTADTGGYIDANVSSFVSSLATRVEMVSQIVIVDGSANYLFRLSARYNGSAITDSESNRMASARTNTSSGRDSGRSNQTFIIVLDDTKIFEYYFRKIEGASNADAESGMSVLAYYEWE